MARNRVLRTLAALAAIFAASFFFAAAALAQAKTILFVAGPRGHGAPGRHEYERDLRTLAESFDRATNLSGVTSKVIVGKLPRDLSVLDGVAAIVIESSSDR